MITQLDGKCAGSTVHVDTSPGFTVRKYKPQTSSAYDEGLSFKGVSLLPKTNIFNVLRQDIPSGLTQGPKLLSAQELLKENMEHVRSSGVPKLGVVFIKHTKLTQLWEIFVNHAPN